MFTKALYFRDLSIIKSMAKVIYVNVVDAETIEASFDQTPCYPKGGG
jgi:hypothetical protein